MTMNKKALVAALAAIILSGCTDDVRITKRPVIAVRLEKSAPTAVYPGTDLDFLFSFKYNPGIRSVRALVDGEVLPESERVFSDFPDSVTLGFTYRPSDKYAGNTIDFAVWAEADDGARGHFDYPVFILASKPDITIAFPDDVPNEFLVDGSPLSFDVNIKSESVDMTRVTTYKGDAVIPEMSFQLEEGRRNFVLPFYYEPSLGDTGSPTTFTVEVMDMNGNFVSASYTVTFTKKASEELNEYSGVVMGLNRCTAAGQFFNALTNTVYNANGVGAVCADVDWCIFWSNNANTQGVAFAAPVAGNVTIIYPEATIVGILGGSEADIPENWPVRNETHFREIEIDADSFAAVSTLEEVIALYEGGVEPANDHVTFKRNAGAAMAFQINRTADSSTGELQKYGLIRVSARNATNNTGSIVFDYKIAK